VISGNVLHGHSLTIDVLPPEGERRSNWVVTDNVSDTVVHGRPMRFFSIDGLVVKDNTQRVEGEAGEAGVVLTDDCGAQVSGNEFGRGVVVRHGARCAAALAPPKIPALAGRTGPSTTIPPSGPTTTRPGRGGSATTTQPGAGSSSESSDTGWIVVAAVLGVLAAVVIAALARKRRGSA
jgi:hypothetical protein